MTFSCWRSLKSKTAMSPKPYRRPREGVPPLKIAASIFHRLDWEEYLTDLHWWRIGRVRDPGFSTQG